MMVFLPIPNGLFESPHTEQQIVRIHGEEGVFGVLDHGIQTIVAKGTEDECEHYVFGFGARYEQEQE